MNYNKPNRSTAKATHPPAVLVCFPPLLANKQRRCGPQTSVSVKYSKSAINLLFNLHNESENQIRPSTSSASKEAMSRLTKKVRIKTAAWSLRRHSNGKTHHRDAVFIALETFPQFPFLIVKRIICVDTIKKMERKCADFAINPSYNFYFCQCIHLYIAFIRIFQCVQGWRDG